MSLQVLKIDLPESYESQIVATEVEIQKRKTREYQQQAAVIRAEINVKISEANRTIANTTSWARAQSFLIRERVNVLSYLFLS